MPDKPENLHGRMCTQHMQTHGECTIFAYLHDDGDLQIDIGKYPCQGAVVLDGGNGRRLYKALKAIYSKKAKK